MRGREGGGGCASHRRRQADLKCLQIFEQFEPLLFAQRCSVVMTRIQIAEYRLAGHRVVDAEEKRIGGRIGDEPDFDRIELLAADAEQFGAHRAGNAAIRFSRRARLL